jgi:hypothetical protein
MFRRLNLVFDIDVKCECVMRKFPTNDSNKNLIIPLKDKNNRGGFYLEKTIQRKPGRLTVR